MLQGSTEVITKCCFLFLEQHKHQGVDAPHMSSSESVPNPDRGIGESRGWDGAADSMGLDKVSQVILEKRSAPGEAGV